MKQTESYSRIIIIANDYSDVNSLFRDDL